MANYDESTYGERIAEIYDSFYETFRTDTPAAVEFLAPLAKGRRVLELGIGTGRIALPLAERGIKMHGVDASPAMVEKLRSKPGGAEIPVEMGNFANLKIGGRFSLIYVAFNTFFGILTQDDQVRCFTRVAKRLTPDGAFVIEAFMPDLSRFDHGQRTATTLMSDERTILEISQLDVAAQKVRAQHLIIDDTGTHRYPVELRFAYPPELDLMARIAGMRLRERWGGWDRRPFTSQSDSHISVYELVPQPVVTPIKSAKRPRLKVVRRQTGRAAR
ncbi:MAG TPA: class I SAM-dependent methyltransferase [Candidatus Binataceae bacterium]|nr:class I SAM-dependent methyltransferase [Candidatus Binataceae bacterium]